MSFPCRTSSCSGSAASATTAKCSVNLFPPGFGQSLRRSCWCRGFSCQLPCSKVRTFWEFDEGLFPSRFERLLVLEDCYGYVGFWAHIPDRHGDRPGYLDGRER